MKPLGFDTETALIRPALCAPPMVCLTWQRPGIEPGIEHHYDSEPRIRSWLQDQDTLLVGQNVAYDMLVIGARFPRLMPLIFRAYLEDRVTDTMLRAQLLDIAAGTYKGTYDQRGKWVKRDYNLQDLARRYCGMELSKDGWRLSYGEFLDTPISGWVEKAKEVQANARPRYEELKGRAPSSLSKEEKEELKNLVGLVESKPEQCLIYPKEDAVATLGVYLKQEEHAVFLKDQFRQARGYFALQLQSAWGLRTYPEGVEALAKEIEAEYELNESKLKELGYVRSDGSRDTKKAKALMVQICREHGFPIRRTDSHFESDCPLGDACETHISLDADAIDAVTSSPEVGLVPDAETLESYAALTTFSKMLKNDVKMLRAASTYPVHTRYGMAATGRTTSSKPNIQNLNTGRSKDDDDPIAGMRIAIRQAFKPRPGKVFVDVDYPQGELYTLAQTCITWFGASKLGDAINAGMDPHLLVAARILRIPYEEAAANKKRKDVDHGRQVGKVFNFGKPGGLGDPKLIVYAHKTYGVTLTPDQVKPLSDAWFEEFPEMRQHFARVKSLCANDSNRATVETLATQRTRGRVSFCAACNNGFQALLADIFKEAAWRLAVASYVDTKSPIFGSRPVASIHDQFILETDDNDKAHDVAFETARIMSDAANKYLSDVPMPVERIFAEALLSRCWSKKAKQVFVNERLVPWSP